MKIPRTQGKSCVIDDEDFALVSPYKWCAQKHCYTFYAVTTVIDNGKAVRIYMHRLLLGLTGGEQTDHRDGDGLNNRWSNLRKCTSAENLRNRPNLFRTNRDGSARFRGIRFKKGKWEAQICVNYRLLYLGRYTDASDAAKAYDKAAIQHFREFAVTNVDLGNYECQPL
jgi:hypothetical protein